MKQYFLKQLLVQLFVGIVPMEQHVSIMQEDVQQMMGLPAASIIAKVCGVAYGAPNQTCNADPESPYLCVTDLPTQNCTSLNTRCEQTSEGCECSTIFGGAVPVSGGVRTVC
jgi:hypothetical protein